MKVFIKNYNGDFAITRITNALIKYAPSTIQFIDKEEDADLSILYSYGHRRKLGWHVGRLLEKNKRYAIVQTSLRGTTNPNSLDWLYIWKNADLVWSYYNLPIMLLEDGAKKYLGIEHINLNGETKSMFPFYYAPLGVDTNIFKEIPAKKKYIIACGGYKFSFESSHEIESAAKVAGFPVFHVGGKYIKPNMDNSNGMSDEELVKYYSQCRYVAGLRRREGFEMLVLEGAICGARPICFDTPTYRHWFGNLAEYIPEGTSEEVYKNLLKYFLNEPRPITGGDKHYIEHYFNWETIIKGFWDKLCQ